METIRNHKWAVIIAVLVFAPTSQILFGALGVLGGFINWGIATLVGLVFLVRWAKPRFSEWLAEDDDDYERVW